MKKYKAKKECYIYLIIGSILLILSIVFLVFNKYNLVILFLFILVAIIYYFIQTLLQYISIDNDKIEIKQDYVIGKKGIKPTKGKRYTIQISNIEKVVTVSNYSLVSIVLKDENMVTFKLSGYIENERKEIIESLPNIEKLN